jgi:hypothetical protein
VVLFSEDGSAFGTFRANFNQAHLIVSFISWDVLPDSCFLFARSCDKPVAISSYEVVETVDNILHYTFSGLTIGETYYVKFLGNSSSHFELDVFLPEMVTSGLQCQNIFCNLLHNQSFETPEPAFALPVGTYSSGVWPNTPSNWASVDEVCAWQRASTHPACTPDYFLFPQDISYGSCANNGSDGNSCTNFAHTGDGVIHLFTIDERPQNSHPDRREYVYTEFQNSFAQGTGVHTGIFAARVNMRLNPNRRGKCSALQAVLTNNFTQVGHQNTITNLGVPQADFAPNISLNDPNWQTAWDVFAFTTVGMQTNYMVLGNFLNNSATQNHLMYLQNANNNADRIPSMFIDDVALYELPNAGEDALICNVNTTVQIGSNPVANCSFPHPLTFTWTEMSSGNSIYSGPNVVQNIVPGTPGVHTYQLEISFQEGNDIYTYTDEVKITVAPDLDATPLVANNCLQDAVIDIPNASDWLTYSFTSPNGSVTWSGTPKLDLATNTLLFSNPQVTNHTGIGLVNGTVTFTFNQIVCTQTVNLQINDCCRGKLQNYIVLPDGANMSTLLPNTQVNNTTFTVYGTITIDDDYTFDNCEFYLMPDAALEVAGGVDVTFERSNLQACGDFKWDRILHDQANSSLTLIECRLRDAMRGVHSINDAALLLSRNFFEANAFCQIIENYSLNVINWDANTYEIRESIYQTIQHPNSTVNLAPYLGIYGPMNGFGIDVISSSGLELTGGNTFWCNTLDNNWQLWIEFSSNVLVENNTFYEGLNIRIENNSTLEAYDNTFELLNTGSGSGPTGIRAYNSTLKIGQATQSGTYSNFFRDGAFIVSDDPVATEIINNYIENYSSYCIDIEHSNPLQTTSHTKVQYNLLKGRWGMRLVNLNTDWPNTPLTRVAVNYNDIYAKRFTNQNWNSTMAVGISASNCNGISIGENTIHLEYGTGVDYPNVNNVHLTKGIWLEDSRNAFIGCNHIYNAGYGLELARDVGKDSWNTYPTYPLNFQYNHFHDNYYGMYWGTLTVMPDDIGYGDLGADNYWIETPGAPILNVARIKDDRNNKAPIDYYFTGTTSSSDPLFPQPPSGSNITLFSSILANTCQSPPSNKKQTTYATREGHFDLEIYPNPTYNELNYAVIGDFTNVSSYHVRVVDMNGRVLLESREEAEFGLLQVSSLSAGLYFFQVEINDTCLTKYFVKR